MRRIFRNYQLFRVDRLSRNGRHAQAKKAAISLLRRYGQSVVYNMLLADVLLVSHEIDAAREQYEIAGRNLGRSKSIVGEDKRYLQAYKNFRLYEIASHKAGKEFKRKRDFAKLIREIDADRQYKRLFSLPI